MRTLDGTDAAGREAVAALHAAATEFDGVEAIDDQVRLVLADPPPGAVQWVAEEGGVVVGHAAVLPDHLTGIPELTLTVHPEHRGRGLGGALARAALTGGEAATVRAWAHGPHPGAVRLAERLDATRARELHQMRMSTAPGSPGASLPAVRIHDGIRVRTFRPGQDEGAWLALNARAFAPFPDQGAWTATELAGREQESWFDPAGFFLAVEGGGAAEGEGAAEQLVAFHWTKIHGDGTGEVYVIGVDPAQQGRGLGRAMTLLGLHHLVAAGVPELLLYVDGSNTAAIGLYHALGFHIARTDVLYTVTAPARPA